MDNSELGNIFAGVQDLINLIRFSGACVTSYRDRCRPSLGYGEARNELYARIMSEGVFTTTTPAWLDADHKHAVGYIVIGDAIALPLREDATQTRSLVAVTAVHREQT